MSDFTKGQLENHYGLNAVDSQGRLFAVVYPDKLFYSESGNPHLFSFRFAFAENPDDIRGLFIDSKDNIYVGLKGFKKGPYGRTYRSRDGGKTFDLVLDRSFWGFDEDRDGNLFLGAYHERNEADRECVVYRSHDSGRTWVDISPSAWERQTHVHHISVSHESSWIYASLGDTDGVDGCWRSKNRVVEIAEDLETGGKQLVLKKPVQGMNGAELVIVGKLWEKNKISCVDGNIVTLVNPVQHYYKCGDGAHVYILDWINKFSDERLGQQYCGICFKDGHTFLADDNLPSKNPENAVVYRAFDDGTPHRVQPTPVLFNPYPSWGAFFLEKDSFGRLWTAVRPFKGPGVLWCTMDGLDWQVVLTIPEEELPDWRQSHSLRDFSIGATGKGVNLTAEESGVLFPVRYQNILTSKYIR